MVDFMIKSSGVQETDRDRCKILLENKLLHRLSTALSPQDSRYEMYCEIADLLLRGGRLENYYSFSGGNNWSYQIVHPNVTLFVKGGVRGMSIEESE